MLRERGDVRGDDAPAFGHSYPDLALTAANDAIRAVAFELQGDAAEVLAERDDLEPDFATGEVDGGAGRTEGFDLGRSV